MAPLQTIGSFVAAAQEARHRALVVSAARVRQQREPSRWRGAFPPQLTNNSAASGQVKSSNVAA